MRPPNNKGKHITKVNALTQAKLIKLLLDGTRSCQELADETGLHYVTVLDYTRYLHREGAAYIVEYQQDTLGRDSIKVFKLGAGKDAKRYALTQAQRSARCRAGKRLREQQTALTLGRPHTSTA